MSLEIVPLSEGHSPIFQMGTFSAHLDLFPRLVYLPGKYMLVPAAFSCCAHFALPPAVFFFVQKSGNGA